MSGNAFGGSSLPQRFDAPETWADGGQGDTRLDANCNGWVRGPWGWMQYTEHRPCQHCGKPPYQQQWLRAPSPAGCPVCGDERREVTCYVCGHVQSSSQ